MKDYSSYTAQDFVLDKDFQRWVISPDDEIRYFWEKWLVEHPEKKREIIEAKASIKAIPFEYYKLTDHDELNMWTQINNQIEGKEEVIDCKQEKQQLLSMQWFKYAAIVMLPLLAVVLYWNVATQEKSFTTGFGEKRMLTLPDGSHVTLNANSSLSYKQDWNENQLREVWLKGEAFFEVEEVLLKNDDTKKKVKFAVHTPQISVEVVGTEFNVKHRDESTEVVLNSGKIMLKKELDSLAMLPGERVVVKQQDKLTKTLVAEPELFSVWRDGAFAFNNASLRDVAEMLEETYGYEVQIKSQEVLERKISSIAPASTRNMKAFLDMLEELYDVEITKSQNVIQIE